MINYNNIQLQKKRIKILFIIIAVVGVFVFLRLFQLTILENKTYADAAKKQHWSENEIQPKRGTIYTKDPNGDLYPLATNIKLYKAYVDLANSENHDKTAQNLAAALNMNKDAILNLFNTSESKRYIPIKRKLSGEEVQKIKDLNDRAIGLEPENWRTYPEKELASQVLGYVNGDDNGEGGIEQYFNEELKGVPGLYKAESDSLGNKILTGRDVSVEAKDGEDLVLTINRDIQAQAESALKNTVEKNHAKSGSVIVVDPKTGAILAMANNPTFDPNNYNEVKDYSLFKNSAISDVYEPGSIFKVLTMAAGLDARKIEPDTKFTDTGALALNGSTIRNSDLKAHGEVTMTYVLEQSLNTGSSFVQKLLGKDLFYDYLIKFGLGIATGIEAPDGTEGIGKVYKPSEVNDHTYATMSFGQSISTTPLQMIMDFAAVANGGKITKPHLVQERIGTDGGKTEYNQDSGKQVISPEAATKLTQMMVSVVVNGHGKQAMIKGYRVAGKTGTAQVPDPKGGYYNGKNIGSFIGFAPADNPRFVVLAKIDEPKGVAWAESTAAPVVGEILQNLLNYYQVPPTEKQ